MAEVTTRDTQLAVDALADALKQDASSGIHTIAQALADAREEGRGEGEQRGLERGRASGWNKNPRYKPKTLQQKLGYLIEECGEVMAATGKSIRWGLDSYNPELPESERETNQAWLLRELADLEQAIHIIRAALPATDGGRDG